MSKGYRIECNEEQLQLMRSAIELQMRLRMGQGDQIVRNVVGFEEPDFCEMRDAYSDVLRVILEKMTINNRVEQRKRNADTKWLERDMWVGIEKALGMRTEEISLGNYGLLKVYETDEETESVKHGHWVKDEMMDGVHIISAQNAQMMY